MSLKHYEIKKDGDVQSQSSTHKAQFIICLDGLLEQRLSLCVHMHIRMHAHSVFAMGRPLSISAEYQYCCNTD